MDFTHVEFRNPDHSTRAFKLLVSRTVEDVTRGLSGLYGPHLLTDANADGMLFAFRSPIRMTMTTRQTLIPLHFAFVDGQGAVSRVAASEARGQVEQKSTVPSRWIVEVDARKWPVFGVQVGARLVTMDDG